MVIGSLFIMIFGFEIAFYELWLGGEHGTGFQAAFHAYWYPEEAEHSDDEFHEGFPVKVNGTHMIPVVSIVELLKQYLIIELSFCHFYL